MVKNKKIIIPVAIAAAIVFFMLFFFGGFTFPRIAVFDLLQSSILSASQAALVNRDGVPSGDDLSNDDRLQPSGVVTSVTEFIKIVDLEEGSGIRAGSGSTVSVGYVGMHSNTEDGETIEFDSAEDPSNPFSFTLGSGQVIAGFDFGIAGMREGGQRLIIIAPEAGYGNQQVGNIPPNTTLHFVVTLYEVQ